MVFNHLKNILTISFLTSYSTSFVITSCVWFCNASCAAFSASNSAFSAAFLSASCAASIAFLSLPSFVLNGLNSAFIPSNTNSPIQSSASAAIKASCMYLAALPATLTFCFFRVCPSRPLKSVIKPASSASVSSRYTAFLAPFTTCASKMLALISAMNSAEMMPSLLGKPTLEGMNFGMINVKIKIVINLVQNKCLVRHLAYDISLTTFQSHGDTRRRLLSGGRGRLEVQASPKKYKIKKKIKKFFLLKTPKKFSIFALQNKTECS